MLTKLQPKISQFEELAIAINREHERCLESPQAALIPACKAGAMLLKVRSHLSEADWDRWRQTHTQISEQTARMYVQIARTWPGMDGGLVALSTPPAVEGRPEPPEIVPESLPPEVEVPPAEEAAIDVEFTPIDEPPEAEKIPNSNVIRFVIPGPVVPKARPRVTNNGTYLPPRYREWRNRAEIELYRQIEDRNLRDRFPLRRAAISIRLFGNHRTNSDIDNLAGACLDALTHKGAGIILDDRLSCLPQLTVEYVPEAPKTGVWIEIEPMN
ncbi:MAG: RusA family crossover junction endodeoxyribonuclease [Limnospira sp.]